jgi:carbon-monoxide dehydrogenase medium subunit
MIGGKQMIHNAALNWPQRLHWEDYYRPSSLSEALRLLEEYKGDAKIIAGGTDVLVQIRRKQLSPRVIVDITRVPGLGQIREEQEIIRLGALVTHSQAAESLLIREKAPALSEGASHVGSPQIRNLGTIAGNLVSGQPGADTAIPLLALGAVVKLATATGERTIPLNDFFVDIGKTAIDGTRGLITEILIPAQKRGETSVYLRLASRRALALPILAVCVVLSADLKKKRFLHSSIALGPVARTPIKAVEAAELLKDAPIEEKVIREAARKAAQASEPRDSLLRGCSDYRKAMVQNLVERGIWKCLERLEGAHA